MPSSTAEIYNIAWSDFEKWCQHHGRDPLPADPETVMRYLTARAGELAPSTLRGRVAAIRHYHQEAGEPSPTGDTSFRRFWKNLRLEGVQAALDAFAPAGSLAQRLTADQRELIPPPSDDLAALRDRAVMLMTAAADLSRSHLVALDASDIDFDDTDEPASMTVALDVVERGATIEIARQDDVRYDPVRAVQAWMSAAEIDDGPLFRGLTRGGRGARPSRLTAQSVRLIVRRAAEKAGFDPTEYSAEDLRTRPAS